MSSKFNIELAQGTVTVEGDEEFIKSVYQALQATLLSGNASPAPSAPAEAASDDDTSAEDPEPESTGDHSAPEETPDDKVTPIKAVESEAAPAPEEAEAVPAPEEEAEPAQQFEPIPAVLDPGRAKREQAEADARAAAEAEAAEEQAAQAATPDQSSVLEQIKDSLEEDLESGSQTSILQRIRDSLSEDKSGRDGEAKETDETPRVADAS